MSENKQIRKTNSFRYAFGMFGTSIPINMFKTFATSFYVDTISAITFEQFAIITAAYTFLDAIDNPIYGFLSDRTRTKLGRRRPWLLIGAPLLVLSYIMFFNPPEFMKPGSTFAYILIMYMLTGTLDSLISTNYGALFPELFKEEADRAKTNTIRQIFQLVAMVLSIALTPIITEKIGFSATAICYGILAIAVIWFMAFGAHEDLSLMEKPKPTLFSSIKAVIVNPKFWKYGVTNAAFAAAVSLVQAGVPFYVKYYLGRSDGMSSTLLLGVAIFSAILFMPAWFKIIKKATIIPAWRMAFGTIVVGMVPLFLVKSLPGAIAVVVIFGFGMAGVQASMDLVSAKILDEDAKKYGVNREGIYSSLLGVLNKTSGLFVSLGYLLVDRLYGFESGDNPGLNPGQASKFLMVVFPAVLVLIGFLFSFTLNFKEKNEKKASDNEAIASAENQ